MQEETSQSSSQAQQSSYQKEMQALLQRKKDLVMKSQKDVNKHKIEQLIASKSAKPAQQSIGMHLQKNNENFRENVAQLSKDLEKAQHNSIESKVRKTPQEMEGQKRKKNFKEYSESYIQDQNLNNNFLSGDFSDIGKLKSHRDYINQHLEMLDFSKIIVPVKVGVKYRPPKLGIEFYLKNDDSFNKSLSSRKHSYESIIINDIDDFKQKILVHEIHLDEFFFTKQAQIYGESSYDENRINQHMSPMRSREQLSATEITRKLFNDKRHKAFMNPNLLKFEQIQRLVQMMITKYTNFYDQRSASRDRSKILIQQQSSGNTGKDKENTSSYSNQRISANQSSTMEKSFHKLKNTLSPESPKIMQKSSKQYIESFDDSSKFKENLQNSEALTKNQMGQKIHKFDKDLRKLNQQNQDEKFDEAALNDFLGHLGVKDVSPQKSQKLEVNYELNPNQMVENKQLKQNVTQNQNQNMNNSMNQQNEKSSQKQQSQILINDISATQENLNNSSSLMNTHVSIDINDTAQLEAMGLKRVQIEGFHIQNPDGTQNNDEEQEFLLDEQGNIYDLNGNFVATMGNDDETSNNLGDKSQNSIKQI